MIYITLADVDNAELESVLCPVCKKKICEKEIGIKVTTLRLKGDVMKRTGNPVIECHRCKSKYFIVTETRD